VGENRHDSHLEMLTFYPMVTVFQVAFRTKIFFFIMFVLWEKSV